MTNPDATTDKRSAEETRTAIVNGKTVQLVHMYREEDDDEYPNGPYDAWVHPDEVLNYRVGNWRIGCNRFGRRSTDMPK